MRSMGKSNSRGRVRNLKVPLSRRFDVHLSVAHVFRRMLNFVTRLERMQNSNLGHYASDDRSIQVRCSFLIARRESLAVG